MFLQMWLAASRDTSDARQELLSYAEAEPDRFEDAEGFVIPYADSPLDGDKVGEMVYMDMIDTAESYVHITSPYLILDDELKTSLCFAARRGTDVRLQGAGDVGRIGVQAPKCSWGSRAQAASMVYKLYPYQLIIPAFFICTTMLSLNMLGDGLRDALDPKMH